MGRERPKEKKRGREMPHACQRPGVGSPRRGGPCVYEERPERWEEGKTDEQHKALSKDIAQRVETLPAARAGYDPAGPQTQPQLTVLTWLKTTWPRQPDPSED